MLTTIKELPPSARCWIFGVSPRFNTDSSERCREELSRFVSEWSSHGTPVRGAIELIHDRFVLIAADVEGMGPSGCSTDGLFRAVKTAVAAAGHRMDDQGDVYYLKSDEVCGVNRDGFNQLVSGGEISGETTVFDTSLSSLSDFLNGNFKLPVKRAWHAKLLEGV